MCDKFLVLYLLVGDSHANWPGGNWLLFFRELLKEDFFAILSVELMSCSVFDKRKQIVFGT